VCGETRLILSGRDLAHSGGDELAISESGHATSTSRHICIVTETYPPEVNGVALTLAHLVKGLLEQGHAVSVVRPRQRTLDGPARDYECDVMLVSGLPLPGYGGLQFGLPAGHLLRRTWSRRRPDVIYVATEGPLGWSAVQAARCLGIPIVSGFHTNYHYYSRHYRVGWSQSLILRYLRRFHNQTASTLVPSADLRDHLASSGFKDVDVLDRGVDSQLFAPQRRCTELRRGLGLSDSDMAVLYVGRIAPEKNLNLAIEAYFAMKRFNPSLKFIIVGDGPSRAALQSQYPDLIFMGTQKGEQLAKYYASADLFLFPSETETFGNVTLEAMASGLGVIAYNYAAAKIHIRHGETGLLIPYGDKERFVESAVRFACEPKSLGMIRQRAREYIKAFDWPRVVEKFESLLFCARRKEFPVSQAPIARRGLAI
jgi:glycosyltransferase involved in cell wall biosynthesis